MPATETLVARPNICSCIGKCALFLMLAAAAHGSTPGDDPQTPSQGVPAGSTHPMMCGPECLWIVMHLSGKEVPLADLVSISKTSAHTGTTVANMIATLEKTGLSADLINTDLESLVRDARRAILLINGNSHFVVFEGADATKVRFVSGTTRWAVSPAEFVNLWGGLAIMVGDSPRTAHTGYRWGLFAVVLLMLMAGLIYRKSGLFRRDISGTSDCPGSK